MKVATFFSFSDTIIYIVTKDSVLETSTNFFFSPLPAIFVFPNDNPEILYKIKISASGKKVVLSIFKCPLTAMYRSIYNLKFHSDQNFAK